MEENSDTGETHMICERCGKTMNSASIDMADLTPIYTCPVCGHSQKAKRSAGQIGSLVVRVLLLFAVGIFGYCFAIIPAEAPTDAMIVMPIGMTVGILCTWGLLRLFGKKGTKRYLFSLLATYILLFILGVNNIPEFIRKIPGENFILIWIVFFAVCVFLSFRIVKIHTDRFVKKNGESLAQLRYENTDFLLMQEASRFRIAGYFLLKGVLCGQLTPLLKTVDEDSQTFLTVVRSERTALQIQKMEENFPNVKILYDSLPETPDPDKLPLRIKDILSRVRYTDTVSAKSPGSVQFFRRNEELDRRNSLILFLGLLFGYSLGMLKLFMGLHNGKPVNLLSGALLFLGVAFVAIYALGKLIAQTSARKKLADTVLKAKSVPIDDFEEALDRFLSGNETPTPDTRANLLRCYALMKPSQDRYLPSKDPKTFAYELLHAVEKLEAEIAEKSSSGGDGGCSGCSGCSSCGGCGGCGGGCGGCGD